MLKEHPEAAAYLQGFDDHVAVIDIPELVTRTDQPDDGNSP
jgi:hypothetical protein